MYTIDQYNPVIGGATYSSLTNRGTSSVSPEPQTFYEHLHRQGEKVPSHKQIIRSGGVASSPYTLDATRFSLERCSAHTFTVQQAGFPGEYVNNHYYSGIPVPIQDINHVPLDTAGLEDEALAKLYDKLRSERSLINGYNFVGELRETISMLRRPLASIRDRLNTVVRVESQQINEMRKFRSSLRRREAYRKMVSGTALEINFGWKPFVSDIRDIASQAQRMYLRVPPRDRIRASSSRKANQLGFTPFFPLGGQWGYWFKGNIYDTWETETSVQYVVGLKSAATVADSAIGRLVDGFGFSAENILPAVYELTPWSWLLDYFTNVGSIIEASATNTANVAWAVKTEKTKTYLTRKCVGVPAFSNDDNPDSVKLVSFSGPDAISVGTRTTLTRTPVVLGIPSLRFKTPFSSVSRVTNMLSVMEQQRRSVRF